MPYYTREMVRWMREQERLARGEGHVETHRDKAAVDQKTAGGGAGAGASGPSPSASHAKSSPVKEAPVEQQQQLRGPSRVLRITPSHVDEDAGLAVSKFEQDKAKDQQPTFDEKRLKYMRNLLRLQVERINRIDGSVPAVGKEFNKYELNMVKPIKEGSLCKLYTVKHREFADLPMVVKVYENFTKKVTNPLYFKMLRHLGKKHPFIVQTWEVFVDRQRILVMQEFANRHDLVTFLAKSGAQSEQVVCDWARQMLKALDYLGDMGIAHSNLKPKYVLINHKELGIRLTGFYNSIVYWDPKKEDIICMPCRPLSSKSRGDDPDFVAPEVFGNGDREEYDPIQADIWSYAAVVYYMATNGGYPYNWREDNPKVEEEIRNNVANLSISEEGKKFLVALLNTNAMARLNFEKINTQVWFSRLKRENVVCSQRQAN